MRKSITLAALLLLACATVFAGCKTNDDSDTPAYKYPDPEPKHARAYKDKGWALYVQYFNEGTRSEGVHGILYHDGVEVTGKEKGETLDTPLSKMTWMGHRSEVAHMWSPSGWYPENKDWMRPSWADLP